MAGTRQRPLSPHLFDGMKLHWQWGAHMLISILHRVTGGGLSMVGGIVLVWWLFAIANGPASYAIFHWAAASWVGQIVLIGLTWSFFEHLGSGLRHFVLDMGAGYELKTNKFWSIVTMLLAILATAAVWGYIYFGKAL